jgi:hypothetical protein
MNQNEEKHIFYNANRPLPNATAVFVLGIVSILLSCFFIGLLPGIIGLLLSKEGRKLYKSNPIIYSDHGLLNAGFILSIIGISISALYSILMLTLIIFQFSYRPHF